MTLIMQAPITRQCLLTNSQLVMSTRIGCITCRLMIINYGNDFLTYLDDCVADFPSMTRDVIFQLLQR